ncbi:hypothetical protein SXM_1023 [Shewanella xiamenensis]|nr:hypothetical protein SXM_1023 [Shewanella xiamenensis]
MRVGCIKNCAPLQLTEASAQMLVVKNDSAILITARAKNKNAHKLSLWALITLVIKS